MKKNNAVEIAILGVLGLLAILTLVIPSLFRDRNEVPLLSLSVLLRDTDTTNWMVARQGMEQAADEFGAELRFLTLTVQNDSREQEELLRREAEGGAAALVVVPINPEGLYTAWLRLASPCPVVTMECHMEGEAGVVSPDNEQVGIRLAGALLEDWDRGDVILLDTSAACPEVSSRLEAAQNALTEAGVSAVRLTALPEGPVDAGWVMAFDMSATRQAAEKKETEAQSYALYGVGCSSAITVQLERGNITAIAAWSDYAAGYLAVQQAVQSVRGQSKVLDPLRFSIIRGEDIYAPENQKLLFPVMSSSGR